MSPKSKTSHTPVTLKSFTKAFNVVFAVISVAALCVYIQFAFFPMQAVSFFRIPVAACRVLKTVEEISDPHCGRQLTPSDGLFLVREMAVLGYVQETCDLSVMLLQLEVGQHKRPVNRDTLNDLFAVYGSIDHDHHLSSEEWKTLVLPAKKYADKLNRDFKGSSHGSHSLVDLGPDGVRIDRIYVLLSKYYANHRCMNESIDCLKIAVKSAEENLGKDSTAYHNCLMQLAEKYHEVGDNPKARALAILSERTLGDPARFDTAFMRDFAIKHKSNCTEFLSELKN